MALVGVSSDEPTLSSKLADELKLGFPLLSDTSREMIVRYGVEDAENEISWPALFVIGKDRKILLRVMLESYKERPTLAQITEAVDAATKAR